MVLETSWGRVEMCDVTSDKDLKFSRSLDLDMDIQT